MTVAEWLASNIGYVIAGTTVQTFLVIWLTCLWKDYAWQKTLGMYGDDISKMEMVKRNETIKRLTVELEDETMQCESLRVKVKRMASLNNEGIVCAGETYRRKPE